MTAIAGGPGKTALKHVNDVLRFDPAKADSSASFLTEVTPPEPAAIPSASDLHVNMAPDSGRRLAQLNEDDTEPAADVSSMSDAPTNMTPQVGGRQRARLAELDGNEIEPADASSVPDLQANKILSPGRRQSPRIGEIHENEIVSGDAVANREVVNTSVVKGVTPPPRRRSARLGKVIDHGSEAEGAAPLCNVISPEIVQEETISPRHSSSATTALATGALDGDDRNIFPFLDLSAELRNKIYSELLSESKDGYDSNLAALKFPSITRASRQLRQESLAFLFAERNFVLYVGSDLAIRSEMRTNGASVRAFGSTRRESSSQCGTLGFKNIVSEFIKGAGASALFRNITFEVYPGEEVKYARYDTAENPAQEQQWHARHHIASLNLKVGDRYRLFASRSLKEVPEKFYLDKGFAIVDITAMLEEVTEAARIITVRDGFKGFTTLDLTRIARGFRFKKNSVLTVAQWH